MTDATRLTDRRRPAIRPAPGPGSRTVGYQPMTGSKEGGCDAA